MDTARRSSIGQLVTGVERQRRPLVNAPDWFNQARARANCRPEVPDQSLTGERISSVPAINPQRGAWINRRSIAIGAALSAVCMIFLFGFWTGRGKENLPQGSTVVVAEKSGLPDAAKNVNPNFGEASSVVRAADRPSTVTQAATKVEVASKPQPAPKPSQRLASRNPAARPVQLVTRDADADNEPESADPFVLQSRKKAKALLTEANVPQNAWFSLASSAADCESGTCKLVTPRKSDGKLDTALEWSASPQAAATQALNEGKLVFLIHVSGNFAQPGFT